MIKDFSISGDMLITIIAAVISFSALLVSLLYSISKKTEKKLVDRYDQEKKMIEIEYMRKNLESQLYDVSRKLEENENRWKDINHLVISSQNKLETIDHNKNHVQQNDFLKNMGVEDNADLEIDNRQIFVLTPFNTEYNETFFSIRKVCERLKLRCIRGDEEFVPNDIFPQILKQIVRSRLIIANITGRNANVMYELGIAHAIGKPTIVIAKNFADVPFDIKNRRIIIFDDDTDLINTLYSSITDLLINKVV